jgi:DNA polymerase alpha subunit B
LALDQFIYDLITPPLQPLHESRFYVGRVCCDSLQDNSQLNDQSLELETCREIGAGARIKLNLATLKQLGASFSVFPGQIIGVEATNPSGRSLNVTALHVPSPLPYAATNSSAIREYYPPGFEAPINILTSSGPFTLDDSLSFEPLEDLAREIENDPPNAVILLGPFIDINHDHIVNGVSDYTVDEVFRLIIAPKLQRIKNSKPNLQVILIPSANDACLEWVAFPQPPLCSGIGEQSQLRLKELGLDQDYLLFPNPVQFTINEVVFAVSSMDIVFDLASVQHTNGSDIDKLLQPFVHVIEQQHFYPMYPPGKNACLDSTRALQTGDGEYTGAAQLKATPDVIIIPSKLKPFAKQVSKTLCVNPGHLVKGSSAGSYARLIAHPFVIPDEEDIIMEHCLTDRCRVEIKRI